MLNYANIIWVMWTHPLAHHFWMDPILKKCWENRRSRNPLKKYFLRVILTQTHYFDIVSDIPSGDIYIYILWHIYSDILYDILSGISSDILCDILSGIYSDILSGMCSQAKKEGRTKGDAPLLKSRDPHLVGNNWIFVTKSLILPDLGLSFEALNIAAWESLCFTELSRGSGSTLTPGRVSRQRDDSAVMKCCHLATPEKL